MMNPEPTQFILYGVTAFSLILVFYFRKKIVLTWVKLKHGKYSYKYLSRYYNYYFEIQFPPSIRYEPVFYILPYFKGTITANEKKADRTIDFGGYKPGDKYPEFFRKIGKPDYLSITDPESDDLKMVVAGFKRNAYNYQCAMLFFFQESTFVMGQYLFKKEKQKIDTKTLAENLLSSYCREEMQSSLQEFMISDENGNKIHFNDNGFAIEITFLNPEISELSEKVKSSMAKSRNFAGELANKAASVTF